VPKATTSAGGGEGEEESEVPDDIFNYYKLDKEDDKGMDVKTVSFEVIQDQIETLQKRWVSFSWMVYKHG